MNTKHLILALTERPGTYLEVITADDRPAIIATDNGSACMIYLKPEQVPAVALAEFKAAGVKATRRSSYTLGAPKHLESIAYDLAQYIEHRDRAAERAAREAERLAKVEAERVAAEEADQRALEAEAVALYLAFYPDSTITRIGEFDVVPRERWINTARHARELHGKS